ncbi:MAG: type II secretion system protein [bacterium]|nr:type II secretion system protein [bacterium]
MFVLQNILIRRNRKPGFSLIEMLVYVSVTAIIMLALSELFFWAIKNQTKIRAIQETTNSANAVMEMIAREIKAASGVYSPTSVFDADNGQLSLKLGSDFSGDEPVYLDIFICESRVCLKREGFSPVAISSEKTEVRKLRFSELANNQKESLKIVLETAFKNPKGKAEKEATIVLNSVVSLRNY